MLWRQRNDVLSDVRAELAVCPAIVIDRTKDVNRTIPPVASSHGAFGDDYCP
jgi:hypothetical protein